ncbi:MAG: porin, partial [Proteobacteria bacterium]|nr:porin [Pseudomonadota bacterium]
MKKVLFATTALIATAGVAAADVSLSGAANVGMINNGTAGAETEMYNNASITATMSGETDNGLSFGASMTVRNGDDVDTDVGDLGAGKNLNPTGWTSATTFGNIFVTGGFGTLTFDRGGIDNLMDDGFTHDVSYAYSVGGLSIGVTADIDSTTGSAGGEDYSMSIVYKADPVTVTVKTDDSSDYDATIAIAVNDMLGVSLNFDTDGQSATESETILKVSFKQGDVSGHVAFADDDDDQWEFGLGYSANNLTLGAVLAENDGAGDTKSRLTASYNLGGGMSINAAT